MSETQKPVEETPVAAPAAEEPSKDTTTSPPAETTAATESETPAATTETPAAEETPKDTPAETTDAPAAATDAPAAEQPKEEAKEVTPVTEGVLGHKGPGLVKGLRFSKRFFYFSDEPVEAKHLTVFHQNEKPVVANPIAAWASQTGKGLLFFTKRAEDKATPAGIFSLADVSDITKDGLHEFHFKVHGQKHTFQAANTAERDGWLASLETKSQEAKAEKETITSSESYKAELEKLTKPAVVPTQKPAEPKEAPKEEGAPAEENKPSAKSRSQSRKRTSIFGTLLGKKEEAEEKKEEKEDKPAEAAAAEAPAESTPAVEATTETPAPAETPKEEQKAEAPASPVAANNHKSKRTSIFGNFFQKVTSPSHEKTEKEATAPVESSVSSTAPQLDNPVEEIPAQPAESENVTPAERQSSKDSTGAPAESPAKDKRRTSFFGNLGIKKEKKGESSDNEAAADGEPKQKSNKLGNLFRKPSRAVKAEKEKEASAANSESKTEEPESSKDAPAEEAPAEASTQTPEASKAAESAEPVNTAATTTPVQAAA